MAYFNHFSGHLSGGFDIDTIAYLSAMSTAPNYKRAALINKTIIDLKKAGVWSKCDAIYIGAAHDQQAARINVMDPTGPLLTAVGSPSFTVDSGIFGSSTGNYWITPFNLNSLTNMQRDSNHLAYWSNVNTSTSNEDIGQQGNLEFTMSARNGTSGFGFSTVTGAGGYRYVPLANTPSAIGLRAMDRSGSSDYDVYQDGVLMTTTASGTRTSVDLLAQPLRIGRSNRLSASGRPLSFITMGASLSAAEHLALKNAVEYYMSNL